jgi:hypothetical protein
VAALNDIDNLALACRNCNGSKVARLVLGDPETDTQVHIVHPRADRWGEHFVFRLTDDGVEIAGTTAVGRTTAVHLHMNSAKAVEARTLWFDFYSR